MQASTRGSGPICKFSERLREYRALVSALWGAEIQNGRLVRMVRVAHSERGSKVIFILSSSSKIAPDGHRTEIATFFDKTEANQCAMALAFQDKRKWYSVTPKEEESTPRLTA